MAQQCSQKTEPRSVHDRTAFALQSAFAQGRHEKPLFVPLHAPVRYWVGPHVALSHLLHCRLRTSPAHWPLWYLECQSKQCVQPRHIRAQRQSTVQYGCRPIKGQSGNGVQICFWGLKRPIRIRIRIRIRIMKRPIRCPSYAPPRDDIRHAQERSSIRAPCNGVPMQWCAHVSLLGGEASVPHARPLAVPSLTLPQKKSNACNKTKGHTYSPLPHK